MPLIFQRMCANLLLSQILKIVIIKIKDNQRKEERKPLRPLAWCDPTTWETGRRLTVSLGLVYTGNFKPVRVTRQDLISKKKENKRKRESGFCVWTWADQRTSKEPPALSTDTMHRASGHHEHITTSGWPLVLCKTTSIPNHGKKMAGNWQYIFSMTVHQACLI